MSRPLAPFHWLDWPRVVLKNSQKYIYVRMFRGSEHLGSRSWYAGGCWVAIITILWVIAWIIAEAIPVFNNLLGLIVRVTPSPTGA